MMEKKMNELKLLPVFTMLISYKNRKITGNYIWFLLVTLGVL